MNDVRSVGTPRWVKVSGVIALVLIVLIGVVLVTGRGDHGPGRHGPGGDGARSGDTGGHRPPPGAHSQP